LAGPGGSREALGMSRRIQPVVVAELRRVLTLLHWLLFIVLAVVVAVGPRGGDLAGNAGRADGR
jgi:hypothetical protein